MHGQQNIKTAQNFSNNFYNVRSFTHNLEEDMQCTYNVTMRRVRVAIVVVGKQ